MKVTHLFPESLIIPSTGDQTKDPVHVKKESTMELLMHLWSLCLEFISFKTRVYIAQASLEIST